MLAKLKRGLGKLLYHPKVRIDGVGPLQTLGSGYGGWTFRPDPALKGATVISAGLGEDASFDVEFAKAFGGCVVIVDPTPRSLDHHESLLGRIGKSAAQDYVAGGRQPVESYPLEDVTASQLVLEDKALWTEATTVKFFLPVNPDHVSHSITNFQDNYNTEAPSIEVACTTLPLLFDKYGLSELQLLKLDIEGAEIAVLSDMLDRGIKPVQLLIEFDELMLRTKRALDRWSEMDHRLRSEGYLCGYFDGRSCFLYALPA